MALRELIKGRPAVVRTIKPNNSMTGFSVKITRSNYALFSGRRHQTTTNARKGIIFLPHDWHISP